MDPLRLLHSQDGGPQKFTGHVIRPIIDFWLISSIFGVIFCQFWSADPSLTTSSVEIMIIRYVRVGLPLPQRQDKKSVPTS